MTFGGRKATLLLFVGDLVVFAFSLWLTLLVRYGELPSALNLSTHQAPFAFLFALWALVFYMAGLYSKQVIRFKSELWGAILRTQLLNIMLAALFFFFTPSIGIAPKTNLAIYLAISLLGIFIWRLALYPRLSQPSYRIGAALVGQGPEVEELAAEVNGNPRYGIEFRVVSNAQELQSNFNVFAQSLHDHKVSLVVIDADDSLGAALPRLYQLAFGEQRYQFADFYAIYGEVFDRVPLSMLRYDWFIKNVSLTDGGLYALSKRVIDIVGSITMGLATLLLIPFVFVAMRIEGKGPLFLRQVRIGQHGRPMTAYKFRSMTFDNAASAEWVGEEKAKNRVTRVGSVLRKTSLDEFPQFVNILRGELSLVGPRNDIAGLAARLAEVIPYYNVRYSVKPGITGWAQINQQYEPGHISPQSIEETKVRLAYDFFYIKNRSLALDLAIALKTVKRLLFRVSAW